MVTSNASDKTLFLVAVNILEAVFVVFTIEIIFSNISSEMALIIGTSHLVYCTLEQNINISVNGNVLEIWRKKI